MILTPKDIQELESMTDSTSGYFCRMALYLERLVRDGVQAGRFTVEQAKEDRELALWKTYAWNNMGGYPNYYKSVQWMAHSEKNAGDCGAWYYRYAVALLYCGKPERSLAYHEKGAVAEPDYPWNWLQLGRLRAHFGDQAGALAAADRGLALVPMDHEFVTLRRELQEGRTLPEMEYHFISPENDQDLQEDGQEPEAIQKRWDIAGILPDPEGLERNKAILQPTAWGLEDPEGFLRCGIRVGDSEFILRFPFGEAAFSHLDPKWLSGLGSRMERENFATCTTHQTYYITQYLVDLEGRAKGIFQNPETGTRYMNCVSGQPVPPPPAL